MAIVQWIGIALTIVGMMWNGYKELPEVQKKFQQTSSRQVANDPQRFQYAQITIAYDNVTGKHWFQHLDGQWRDFPPRP
jgi:hypothetical protein